MHKRTQIWSLYRITNTINNKIYIGQAADLSKRWSDHRRAVRLSKPTQVIHHAMIKYGIENFEFDIIASCTNQDDANYTETKLVEQYESHISTDKGYNITLGGMNAPKTEAFKQMMRNWHASLSDEERAKRSKQQSEGTLNQIATKGHPAQGTKRTPEQSQNLSRARQEHPVEYTDEIRQRMSEAHLGIQDSEETKQRKSESASQAWEKRIDYSRKCQAPNCEVSGKTKYKIIDGIRYCNKHGLRMLRYNRLDTLDS
jgi:group I intron endonuclease